MAPKDDERRADDARLRTVEQQAATNRSDLDRFFADARDYRLELAQWRAKMEQRDDGLEMVMRQGLDVARELAEDVASDVRELDVDHQLLKERATAGLTTANLRLDSAKKDWALMAAKIDSKTDSGQVGGIISARLAIIAGAMLIILGNLAGSLLVEVLKTAKVLHP